MRNITTLLMLLFIGYFSNAQVPGLSYYLPEDVKYNEKIPTPEQVIGHPVGKWHITHDKLVMYMKALAEKSDRITIEDRGKTFEDRPLILLTITSPENHNKIEEIRTRHLKLSQSGSENIEVDEMPVIVYQGFSIHGNEPSGSNAALLGAYHLAAAQGEGIEDLLNNTVILFDPSFNPDGLQRFAQWVNIHKSENLNPDNYDREYDEVWPGGRTNHYWFDMNRDWLPVQLPESRARIETYHNWLPNVLTDHHEMGTNATFFFQPGVPSRTHPLTPSKNQKLTADLAQFHSEALDNIGSLYYSGEGFDDFYYGKGSTFPDINGGIGILFEQASSRGHIQESDHGLLTFPFTIRNQFTALLSTLEGSLNLKNELLEFQKTFYNDARKSAKQRVSKGGEKGYIFGSEKDGARSSHMAEILLRHKIKVFKPSKNIEVGGQKYSRDKSYFVPFDQDKYLLIEAIFEKRTEFEDSLFYDVSAWSYPLSFNLNHSTVKSNIDLGPEVKEIEGIEGGVENKSSYAYLFEWHEYYTPKALYKILAKGIRPKVGRTPFTLEGTKYDYGTIMIPVQNQKLSSEELYSFLNEVAMETGITIKGVSTGLTQGIDLGSNDFEALKLPKIAVLVGSGISSYDAGEIWHLMDQRYDILITKLDVSKLSTANLNKYTTILAPSSYGNILKGNAKDNLTRWVEQGGTLIGFRSASGWMKGAGFLNFKTKSKKVEAKDISFEEKGRFSGAQATGGAIFEAKLDLSHPIAWGYDNDKLPLFRNTNIYLEPEEQSYNNPIQYTGSPLLSGYISEENLEILKNSVPFKVNRKGRGKVLYFTDNPNFRAFWYGTNKLMMNGIFFSKIM